MSGTEPPPRNGRSPMNRWPPLVAVVLSALALAAGPNRDPRVVPQYDARTFYETTTYFGASFSVDARHLLISSDASGVFNAYSVPVEGGAPRQLTHSKGSAILAVSYFPHDDRILYTQDEGGNELNHL